MNASNPQVPYSLETLLRKGERRRYRGAELAETAFPLGGIGTGMISLGGWGQLRDFEVFNRPHKGLAFEGAFLTLYAKKGGGPSVTKVVQGPVLGGSYTGGGRGALRSDGKGLPHFRGVEFVGAFPFGRVELDDPGMPLEVALEAYNPFIPLNADDSSLPVAILNCFLANPTDEPVEAVLFANLENKIGFPEVGGGLIEYFDSGACRGLSMSTEKHGPDSPRFGTLALATPHDDVDVQTHWFRGAWFDALHRFWDEASGGEFAENRQPARPEDEADPRRRPSGSRTDVGSIGLRCTVEPGESARLPVWIVWHNPNFEKYWHQGDPKPAWKNHYATIHRDAVAVADYVARNEQRLESETRAFQEALFSSTLPASVLDAVSSQISILKSTTCLRLEDGTLYGWEGCDEQSGCCEGTCTHVWNYAQALPYLFPSLERSVRDADYAVNMQDDGHMTFRMPVPLGVIPEPHFHAAADGQLGGVMKAYRDWQLCGDDEWLRKIWPQVRRSLEYAWEYWDRDRDGVMEGVQHNTYDIEFYGPNTMLGSFYLGALRAAEEMARHLDEDELADTYRGLYESGRAKMDDELFNGEYYIQDVRLDARAQSSHDSETPQTTLDPGADNWPKYQYGTGCLSDQLIGQWYARMLGLGDLFDPEHVKAAVRAIFRHNWRGDLWEHANPQRIYAINDEAGLLLTSWPRGGRPAFPFPYSDEVWPGIEYQVASHLIYEGDVEEGIAIVQGARDRHTGVRRNPWNEIECGNHYARSMASYAVLLALADFRYSGPSQSLRFAPRVYENDFACFFAVDSGWGMVKQSSDLEAGEARVEVHRGELALSELHLGISATSTVRVLHGERELSAAVDSEGPGTVVRLSVPLVLHAGEAMRIRFSSVQ